MGFTVFFFLSWLVISIFAVVGSMRNIVENYQLVRKARDLN
jgi:hypothetical protein